jgi:hypothetical protein
MITKTVFALLSLAILFAFATSLQADPISGKDGSIIEMVDSMVTNQTFGAFCASYFSYQSKALPSDTAINNPSVYRLVADKKLRDHEISEQESSLLTNFGQKLHAEFDTQLILLAGYPDANTAKTVLDAMDYIEKLCREKLTEFNQTK